MRVPQMIVVAGPAGSGKSSLLRPQDETDYFNADERARDLNSGSGHNIPVGIRAIVNQELESFILDHINEGRSFCYETTLRTSITYDQARLARVRGFRTVMHYIAVDSPELSIVRVRTRSELGGHSAPPERLREIYQASLKNLPRALKEFDSVAVFDNSNMGNRLPYMVLATEHGQFISLAEQLPGWIIRALQGTEYEITEQLRSQIGFSY